MREANQGFSNGARMAAAESLAAKKNGFAKQSTVGDSDIKENIPIRTGNINRSLNIGHKLTIRNCGVSYAVKPNASSITSCRYAASDVVAAFHMDR